MEKLLSFEEWYVKNENELVIKLAETGADREMGFDLEQEAERAYNEYVKKDKIKRKEQEIINERNIGSKGGVVDNKIEIAGNEYRSVNIWVDGSCKNNSKNKVSPGGWAAMLIDQQTYKKRLISGGKDNTTNNEMELEAVYQAISVLKRDSSYNLQVVFYTDSQYLIGLFNDSWRAEKHAELVKTIKKLIKEKTSYCSWIKVKAHSGVPENEYVDNIASAEAESRRVTPASTPNSDSTIF